MDNGMFKSRPGDYYAIDTVNTQEWAGLAYVT